MAILKVEKLLELPYAEFLKAVGDNKKCNKKSLMEALQHETRNKNRISHVNRIQQRIRKLSSREVL